MAAVGEAEGVEEFVDDSANGDAEFGVSVAVDPGVECAAGEDGQG